MLSNKFSQFQRMCKHPSVTRLLFVSSFSTEMMQLKSVVLLLLLTLVLAEEDTEINDPYDDKTTSEYVADVKVWADKMSPETFRACDIVEDLPQDSKQWKYLFRMVSCKAKNAIKQ